MNVKPGLADTERRIQVNENKCLRRLPLILYREYKTNDFVRNEIIQLYSSIAEFCHCDAIEHTLSAVASETLN